QVTGNLVNGSGFVQATSSPVSVIVQKHVTSLTLTKPNNIPWGTQTSFTSTLKDTDAALTLSGKTIHFNGTGVIGVADLPTNSSGIALGTGTAPNTVSPGWKAQSHFAGDLLYNQSDSAIKTFGTLRHATNLVLAKHPNTPWGKPTSFVATLNDITSGIPISGR